MVKTAKIWTCTKWFFYFSRNANLSLAKKNSVGVGTTLFMNRVFLIRQKSMHACVWDEVLLPIAQFCVLLSSNCPFCPSSIIKILMLSSSLSSEAANSRMISFDGFQTIDNLQMIDIDLMLPPSFPNEWKEPMRKVDTSHSLTQMEMVDSGRCGWQDPLW